MFASINEGVVSRIICQCPKFRCRCASLIVQGSLQLSACVSHVHMPCSYGDILETSRTLAALITAAVGNACKFWTPEAAGCMVPARGVDWAKVSQAARMAQGLLSWPGRGDSTWREPGERGWLDALLCRCAHPIRQRDALPPPAACMPTRAACGRRCLPIGLVTAGTSSTCWRTPRSPSS